MRWAVCSVAALGRLDAGRRPRPMLARGPSTWRAWPASVLPAAVAAAWLSSHEPAHPAPARARGRLLAAAPRLPRATPTATRCWPTCVRSVHPDTVEAGARQEGAEVFLLREGEEPADRPCDLHARVALQRVGQGGERRTPLDGWGPPGRLHCGRRCPSPRRRPRCGRRGKGRPRRAGRAHRVRIAPEPDAARSVRPGL